MNTEATEAGFWATIGPLAFSWGLVTAGVSVAAYAIQYFWTLRSDPSLWGALLFLPLYLLFFAALGGLLGALLGFAFGVIRFAFRGLKKRPAPRLND